MATRNSLSHKLLLLIRVPFWTDTGFPTPDFHGALLLEGVRGVFQENEAEHDVLVLGGVQVVAELVGGQPELRLESERRPVAVLGLGLRSCHGDQDCYGINIFGCHCVCVSTSSSLIYHNA